MTRVKLQTKRTAIAVQTGNGRRTLDAWMQGGLAYHRAIGAHPDAYSVTHAASGRAISVKGGAKAVYITLRQAQRIMARLLAFEDVDWTQDVEAIRGIPEISERIRAVLEAAS